MQYRKIGTSDLEVSVVSLGTWVFGGDCWGEASDEDSVSAVKEAINKGVNFIDTAPIYGAGRSEAIIGKALENCTEEVIIATKCGLEQKGKGIRPNLSKEFIREEIENSLRRLKIETIDLYQCHWPDPNTQMEETFGTLNDLIEEGKIRFIGVSNFDKDQIEQAIEHGNIVSNQMQYSLLDRRIEKDLIPYCIENNISILSYGPLGGGILTGKYDQPPEIKKGDVKSFFYNYYQEPLWSKSKALVSVLKEMAGKHKVPVSQVAINWVTSKTVVASAITGARNPRQLNLNVGAGDWMLSDEERDLIENEYKKMFG